MEDSWSFDGSIVSLSEAIGPSNNASASSLRADDDSAVSAHEEDNNRVSTAAAPSETSGEPALAFSASRLGDMSTAAPAAERDERDRVCGPTSTPAHLAGASTAPTGCLSETAAGQTVNRGRPGVRMRGGGATAAATRSTSVSSTTSTDGSAASSSLPSSSAKISDAETASQQDGAGASAFVMPSLNMGGGTTTAARYRQSPATTEHPSSVPDGAAAASQRLRSSGWSDSDGIRILVLGSTADDRCTFAKLVSLDDDDEDRSRNRVQGSASSEGVTDMSFSFLSARPAQSSHRTESRSAPLPAPPRNDDETFEALSPRAGSATLFHLTDDELSTADLLDKLQIPFERLEAKISRTYPATDRLADLVSSASCGSFDACLFLFSSPPTAREVALARTVSRLVPLFPVLLLPPPPSGKSQKTKALCHAVQEQLNGADVRWLPASSLEGISRRRGRRENGGGGGGPLFMLPHDLFAQQLPPALDPHAGPCGDSPPFSAPLSSRDSPNSLASSQELFALPPTPHSPALTTMSSAPPSSIGTGEERSGRHGARREGGVRSLLASGPPSTRAGSSASRSDSRRRSQQRRRRGHRGSSGGGEGSSSTGGGGSSSESDSTSDSRHMYGSSTSLADLKRLQFILHDPSLSDTLHQLAALVFLEWREVEIAAAAAAVANGSSRELSTAEPRADLPSEWGETLLEDERGASRDMGTNTRKGLDFSRRVAERRRALQASAPATQSRGIADLEQTETETQEDEAEGAPITASTTRESTTSSAYWTDPTTPRCIQRGLPSFAGGVGGATTVDRAGGGEGYFPSTSNAGVPWLDSASEFASPSTEEVEQPTSAPRPLSPTSLVYLSPADPFHLPSLIHLVGLNLRLAFDPAAGLARSASSSAATDAEAAGEEVAKSTSVWSWWRTAATVGLVFAAGVAIGAHVISRRAILFGPSPTLATAAVIASPADWASWSPAVLIRS